MYDEHMPQTAKDQTTGEAKARQLLEQALEALRHTTGLKGKVVNLELGDADGRVKFDAPMPPYLVEIKRQITPAGLGPLLARIRQLPGPTLLVTHYVTPPMAERLCEEGIQFIDTAGNAWLQDEGGQYFVFVVGRKPARPTIAEKPIKAFRAPGLKVIFPLICLPGALEATYREIADTADVALGTVANTLEDLKRLGLLRKTKNGHVLQDRQRLIDLWVDAYPRELRPRLKPRRYRVRDQDWWRRKNAIPVDTWLGGEAGAALLTDYLKPELATIYGDRGFDDLARKIRPAKDDTGNLEVLEAFWAFEPPEVVKGYRLAPPLLIYADLIATADARNLETAGIVRERYLD